MSTACPLAPDTDWDLFASYDEDDDGNISFKKLTELNEFCSVSNLLNDLSCTHDTQISDDLNDFKQQTEIYNSLMDEVIKLEESYESDSTSTQSTSPSSSLTPHNSSPSLPPATPQIPEFDQLQNLPHEIVERSRFLSLILR